MKLGQDVQVDFKDGKVVADFKEGAVVLSANVGIFAVPVIDGLISKVQSGEIDPIKGTDLDKEAMLKALAFLKSELMK